MRNELACAIVMDLLPSYIDRIASTETAEAVKLHLEHCSTCKEYLERMNAEEPKRTEERREIDYLKKTRNRMRNKALLLVLALILLVATICLINHFCNGTTTLEEELICSVQVNGNDVHLSVSTTDKKRAVSDIIFNDSYGELRVDVRTVPAFFFRGGKTAYYSASRKVSQIVVGDRIVWSDGKDIAPEISKAYQMRYVAEASDLLDALETRNVIGRYQVQKGDGNSLNIYTEKTRAEVDPQLCRYSVLLLALCPELQTIEIRFPDGNSGLRSLSSNDVSRLLKTDIKTCIETAGDLQRLFDRLGNEDYFRQEDTVPEEFYLILNDFTDGLEKGIEVTSMTEGKDFRITVAGEKVEDDTEGIQIPVRWFFTFPMTTSAEGSTTGFQFSITIFHEDGTIAKLPYDIWLTVQPGSTFFYDLQGDREAGYSLNYASRG